MKILITGANGFVGSHILEQLVKLDFVTPIAACRSRDKLLDSFKGEVRAGDLRDENYLNELVKGIDVICHAAAWTSLWGHENQSRELFYEPTINLIEKAKNAGVSKFIFTSSTAVAEPGEAEDALSPGVIRTVWPHLNNVVKVERKLLEEAYDDFKVVSLRIGLFVGNRYALGLLPILLPRLKTHLVPWIKGGSTHLPLIDGRDIGQAFSKAVTTQDLPNYEAFNILGKNKPTVRQVINYIHKEFGYPKPHFSVPFFIAYPFAYLMELIDPIVPWEPLVTRSIVHLFEDSNTNNNKATEVLGYQPEYDWELSVWNQIHQIHEQKTAMSMARPVGGD